MNPDHEEYVMRVILKQFRYFGPFPAKFEEIASPEIVRSLWWLMQKIPREKTTPFTRTTEREIIKTDNVFISKIMQLDWRDRSTAEGLLEDEWSSDDED